MYTCICLKTGRAKRELTFYTKLYDEDVSFNSIRQRNGRFDLTHNLENIVFHELFYMGYDLYVFTQNGQEIDFVASYSSARFSAYEQS